MNPRWLYLCLTCLTGRAAYHATGESRFLRCSHCWCVTEHEAVCQIPQEKK